MTSRRRDRFYFYPDKWLISTRGLSLVAKGLYIDLIALCQFHDEPQIPVAEWAKCYTSRGGPGFNRVVRELETAGKITRIDDPNQHPIDIQYAPNRVPIDLQSDPRSKHFNGLENSVDIDSRRKEGRVDPQDRIYPPLRTRESRSALRAALSTRAPSDEKRKKSKNQPPRSNGHDNNPNEGVFYRGPTGPPPEIEGFEV